MDTQTFQKCRHSVQTNDSNRRSRFQIAWGAGWSVDQTKHIYDSGSFSLAKRGIEIYSSGFHLAHIMVHISSIDQHWHCRLATDRTGGFNRLCSSRQPPSSSSSSAAAASGTGTQNGFILFCCHCISRNSTHSTPDPRQLRGIQIGL